MQTIKRPNGTLKREHIFALSEALGTNMALSDALGLACGSNISNWRTGKHGIPQHHLDKARTLWDEKIGPDATVKVEVPPPKYGRGTEKKAKKAKGTKAKKAPKKEPKGKRQKATPAPPVVADRPVVVVNTVSANGVETSVQVFSDGQVRVDQVTPTDRAVDKVIEQAKRSRKRAKQREAHARATPAGKAVLRA